MQNGKILQLTSPLKKRVGLENELGTLAQACHPSSI
jgi:hypothetical protein